MNILRAIHLRTNSSTDLARPRTKQTGQAAVEIALTLPLLLLILLGIAIAVFTFYAYIQVSNAAREGARAGALYRITYPTSSTNPTPSLTLLQQTVQKAIYDSSATPVVSALGTLPVSASTFDVASDVSVAYSGNPAVPEIGDVVTVTVRYRYTMPILAKALPMFPQPLRIVRSVVMEVQ